MGSLLSQASALHLFLVLSLPSYNVLLTDRFIWQNLLLTFSSYFTLQILHRSKKHNMQNLRFFFFDIQVLLSILLLCHALLYMLPIHLKNGSHYRASRSCHHASVCLRCDLPMCAEASIIDHTMKCMIHNLS